MVHWTLGHPHSCADHSHGDTRCSTNTICNNILKIVFIILLLKVQLYRAPDMQLHRSPMKNGWFTVHPQSCAHLSLGDARRLKNTICWKYYTSYCVFIACYSEIDIHCQLLGVIHKVRHAIFGQYWPPSLCHTLSHIPGPPKSTSHILDPPNF